MIGRSAFIVKHIDPAALAEIMFRNTGVPLIEPKRPLARRDGEVCLGHFHHNRPAHRAQRAVASRELGQGRGDLELDSGAMAFGEVGWPYVIVALIRLNSFTLKSSGVFQTM